MIREELSGMADQKSAPLTLQAMEDDSGNSLERNVARGLGEIEEHIQRYMTANMGEHPTKPYKLNVAVEITAAGSKIRDVT